MGKIKLRVTNFGYVVGIDVIIMYTNFQMKLCGLLRSYGTTHLLLVQMSGNLQYALRVVWSNIPTKFEVILKKLIF